MCLYIYIDAEKIFLEMTNLFFCSFCFPYTRNLLNKQRDKNCNTNLLLVLLVVLVLLLSSLVNAYVFIYIYIISFDCGCHFIRKNGFARRSTNDYNRWIKEHKKEKKKKEKEYYIYLVEHRMCDVCRKRNRNRKKGNWSLTWWNGSEHHRSRDDGDYDDFETEKIGRDYVSLSGETKNAKRQTWTEIQLNTLASSRFSANIYICKDPISIYNTNSINKIYTKQQNRIFNFTLSIVYLYFSSFRRLTTTTTTTTKRTNTKQMLSTISLLYFVFHF